MALPKIQYIIDQQGEQTGVIVPIEVWNKIISERETEYLLSSPTMKKRLIDAIDRNEGIPFEAVREKLNI